MTIAVDFFSDWKCYMLSYLIFHGYQVSQTEPLDAISYKFFNVRRRRIQAVPRAVHESPDIACPVDYKAGYQSLKSKFVAGDDVIPHLSKNLLNADYEDPLLNDWGIHHFHLGKSLGSSGFTDRTGLLLFAFITPSDAYFINVLPHGAWSDQDLVRILHRNWSTAISHFHLKGVLGLSLPISNQTIKEFRKVGISTCVEVEQGVVYASMGGGYSTAGTSIEATMQSGHYHQHVQNMETYVRENLDFFLKEISELNRTPANPPAFSLVINNKGFYALETGSQVAFLLHSHTLFPLSGQMRRPQEM